MALDDLFRLDGDDAVFVIGRDRTARRRASSTSPSRMRDGALSLSSMPRLRDDAERVHRMARLRSHPWARANGYERVSLNFAPFAALLGPSRAASGAAAAAPGAARDEGPLPARQPAAFNRKFFPAWEPRFVVYERRLDLPRVGIAALAAEATCHSEAARKMTTLWPSGSCSAGVGRRPQLGLLRQHGAAAACRRSPCGGRALAALLAEPRWLAGFLVGLVGWVFYVAALRFAPLSLVQAVSAGGLGVLALLVRLAPAPPRRRGRGVSARRSAGSRCSASRSRDTAAGPARRSRSRLGGGSRIAGGGAVAGPGSAFRVRRRARRGSGDLYATGDIATKPRWSAAGARFRRRWCSPPTAPPSSRFSSASSAAARS